MSELVSVIVPVYNVEQYLEVCLDSIIKQTYKNIEIIVVDDGSTDDSGDICDDYSKIDNRIKVIHQSNKGLSGARNTGLDVATGDYICFIDSDDWIDQNMITKMVESIQVTGADLSICGFEKKYLRQSNVTEDIYQLEDVVLEIFEFLKVFVEKSNVLFVIVCNKLYKKRIFNNLRFLEDFIHEDEAIMHRIYGECKKIVTISDVFYYYRQSDNSITRQAYNIKRTDVLTGFADRITYSYRMNWDNVVTNTLLKYDDVFWECYFKFQDNEENHKYFLRMEKSLRTILPHLLKCNRIRISHKFWMTLICINPNLYRKVNRIIRTIKR